LLDEPTTGLHPEDVALLLRQLHRLVAAGNTVVVVEHDLDTIATADWIIDLGPGGGDAGGTIVAAGTPAEVALSSDSVTAPYLARRLSRHARERVASST
jgi:excinuclease ABC subunit A